MHRFVAMATDMDYTYAPIEVIGDKIYMFTNYNAAEISPHDGGHQ